MIPTTKTKDKDKNLDSNGWILDEDNSQSDPSNQIDPAEFCFFCNEPADQDGAICVNENPDLPILINGQKICFRCGFYELPKHTLWSLPGINKITYQTLGSWFGIYAEAFWEAATHRMEAVLKSTQAILKLEIDNNRHIPKSGIRISELKERFKMPQGGGKAQ